MDAPSIDIVRAVRPAPIVRAAGDDAGAAAVLSGHFSVCGVWYEIDSWWEGRFLEQTAHGAFLQTIADDRDAMRCLFNHGHDVTLGNQVLGSIDELREDGTGPYYEVGVYPGVPELLMAGLRDGAYGASFRFRVVEENWNDEPGASDHNPLGLPERTILRTQTFEFGPVTWPANPDATAGVRSLTDEYYEQLRTRNPGAVTAADLVRSKTSIGRPGARSAGGDGHGTRARTGSAPTPTNPSARHRALQLSGVVKP